MRGGRLGGLWGAERGWIENDPTEAYRVCSEGMCGFTTCTQARAHHVRVGPSTLYPPFGGGAVVRRVLRNVSGHPSTNFSGEMRALELTYPH